MKRCRLRHADATWRSSRPYVAHRVDERERMRRGTTLPELLLVLTIMGILGTIAIPKTVRWRDRTSVRSAALETVATLAVARRWSLSRSSRTAITFDTIAGTL